MDNKHKAKETTLTVELVLPYLVSIPLKTRSDETEEIIK